MSQEHTRRKKIFSQGASPLTIVKKVLAMRTYQNMSLTLLHSPFANRWMTFRWRCDRAKLEGSITKLLLNPWYVIFLLPALGFQRNYKIIQPDFCCQLVAICTQPQLCNWLPRIMEAYSREIPRKYDMYYLQGTDALLVSKEPFRHLCSRLPSSNGSQFTFFAKIYHMMFHQMDNNWYHSRISVYNIQ